MCLIIWFLVSLTVLRSCCLIRKGPRSRRVTVLTLIVSFGPIPLSRVASVSLACPLFSSGSLSLFRENTFLFLLRAAPFISGSHSAILHPSNPSYSLHPSTGCSPLQAHRPSTHHDPTDRHPPASAQYCRYIDETGRYRGLGPVDWQEVGLEYTRFIFVC